ncbi:putative sugar dehydratase/epimerase YfnG [groundwater metagenome]|uniref:Putative sugar dehydratase/epimerase YfnG n=1 Tax=groundwater metagenome TaxID=717931 RepID=A0A098E6M3_9ZZZZ
MGIKKSTMENMERLDFWKGKNVLVTGGNGLVGSHIVEELLWNNANVIVLIRSQNPKSYFVTEGLDKKTILAYGDLKDFKRIHDIISKYEIEYIFHLGAQPIVPTALINPVETFGTNINGTINVLESARLCNSVKGIVVASSDKAYGISKELPYTEETQLKGTFPYDVSKTCTDLLAQSYFKTYNVPITIARFGNIYGPGDLNFNRIIPGAIKATLLNETLKIRSDGKMIREYLYVKDVADGYLMLCENINKSKGEAFNLSNGLKLSVLEVIERISQAINKKINYKILNIAKNEIYEQHLSTEKVEKFFGWRTKYSFEDGIKKTVKWYEKILNIEK